MLGKCGGDGVHGRECFCGSVIDIKDGRWTRKKRFKGQQERASGTRVHTKRTSPKM